MPARHALQLTRAGVLFVALSRPTPQVQGDLPGPVPIARRAHLVHLVRDGTAAEGVILDFFPTRVPALFQAYTHRVTRFAGSHGSSFFVQARFIWGCTTVCLTVRLTRFFLVVENLGPKVHMLAKMVGDVKV